MEATTKSPGKVAALQDCNARLAMGTLTTLTMSSDYLVPIFQLFDAILQGNKCKDKVQ